MVLSLGTADAATVSGRFGKATARRAPKRTPAASPTWLVHKRRALLEKGADQRHFPRIHWVGGEPGVKTRYATLLVHGIAESPWGMSALVPLYLAHGNVLLITLNGHGINEGELLNADRRRWYQDVREAVLFGREYIGDELVLGGFSVGGALGLVQQLDAAFAGRRHELVSGLALHSPVILRGKGLSETISIKQKGLRAWKADNTAAADHEWLGYYMGSEESNPFAMRAPLSLFHELNKIAIDNRPHLKIHPSNAALRELVAADTKIAAYMARRDTMLNFSGTMRFVQTVAQLGGDILTYSTDARMRHDDTVRESPKTRKGDITIERFDRGETTELTMSRKTAISAFVDDFWNMVAP
jgi:pimeloyl-ACP methyl ester carboxylesterase